MLNIACNFLVAVTILLIGSIKLKRRLTMKMKVVFGFALMGLSLASAKSYEISIDSVSKVGDVQLRPGDYTVTLNGTTVKFTDENSGKSVETTATVETTAEAKFNGTSVWFTRTDAGRAVETMPKAKFDFTAVETVQKDGVTKVNEIDLGGTRTDLKFK